MSKWSAYKDVVNKVLSTGRKDYTQIARELLTNSLVTEPDSYDVDKFRTWIWRQDLKRDTSGNDVRQSLNHIHIDGDNTLVGYSASSDSYDKEEEESLAPTISAWNPISGQMMDIEEYCEHYNLPFKDIRSYKLVSHTGTPYYNILFREQSIEESINYNEVIKEVIENLKITRKPTVYQTADMKGNGFTRAVITDVHVGMDPDSEGISMYPEPWNADTIRSSFIRVAKEITSNINGPELYLDDLGDFLDGYDGYTTRGGHKLPQNMTNVDAFKTALEVKLMLLDMVYDSFSIVHCNNICNDNHSGDFGAMLNIAFKQIAEERYPNVTVNNMFSFINHYHVGHHAFILSHGKDKKNLKFGFKPVLDAKQIEHIEGYIKANSIYSKSKYIEFSKGDSHQFLLDYSTAQGFNYFNYPALSPSSEWVQTNFKKGRRGFVIQHGDAYKEDLTIIPITL